MVKIPAFTAGILYIQYFPRITPPCFYHLKNPILFYMETISQKQCLKCNTEASEAAYFCYNCGQVIKPRPESTSVSRQILIYLVSFFLAPFGLVFAFKYLSQPDKKSKTIGIISIILTVVSIGAALLVGKTFIDQQYGILQSINSGGLF